MRKFYLATLTLCTSLLSFSSYAHLPEEKPSLSFVQNKGQWENEVRYRAAIGGGYVWLEEGRFTFLFHNQQDMDALHRAHHGEKIPAAEQLIRKQAYRLLFTGANPSVKVSADNSQQVYHNFYLGADPSRWVSKAATYARVQYSHLYPGIHLQVHSEEGYFKYDFIVTPGTDPALIGWRYEGISPLLKDGDLILHSQAGTILEKAPVAWQEINGEKIQVPCRYVLREGQVSFQFPSGYDARYTLVIDPTLIFSSYSGSGADNWGFTATYDNQGNLYSGSVAFAAGYPTTTGASQTTFSGGTTDVVISKFSSAGNTLLYSTYLGGNNSEVPHSLIVDEADNLYVMGTTGSNNFPITGGSFQTSFQGGSAVSVNNINYSNGSDIFISRFNATGTSLLSSTYVGGNGNDGLNLAAGLRFNYADQMRGEIVLDAAGNVYVASSTLSGNFPVTGGSLSNTLRGTQDGCAFKMDANLSGLAWSTYIGGSSGSGNDASYSIKIAANNDVYICGGTTTNDFPVTGGTLLTTAPGGATDAYIVALSGSDGSQLYGTYLGTNAYDQTYLLEIDIDENIYVVGQTQGSYPISGGVYSVPNSTQFIHKLNPTLSATLFSTTFGSGNLGTINIAPTAFLVDNCKNIYVSGWGGGTNAATNGGPGGNTNNMPITADAYRPTTDGSDFYFIVLDRDATSLLYGSYFGSGSLQEHVDGGTSRFDKNGVIYQAVCAGCGGSNNFPTTPGVWSTTNGSSNCNLGVIKMEFNYTGVVASADAAPNVIACDPPFEVNFTGTAGVPQHRWDFGDGTGTSTQPNPSYVYTDTGSYTVMYIAIDSTSCNIADTAYLSVLILEAEEFSAQFNVDPYDPCLSDTLNVHFEFTGTGADSLVWDMGDGTIYNSTTVNHTYYTQNTYIVSMTAYDFDCGKTETFTDTIVYLAQPIYANADAAPNVIACDPPFEVHFTGTASVPQHRWDFGDGTGTSTQPNPSYVYTDTGSYTVMYIAIDSTSCNIADTAYLSVLILEAEEFSAQFNVDPYDPCLSDTLNVHFEFTGTGADSLVWDMGDGTIYNSTTVNHTYYTQNTYIVSMTAYDFTCGKTETFTDTIRFFGNPVHASADASPNVIACDPPFVVNFSNGGGTSPHHYWNFGDGTGSSTQPNPSYTYTQTGNYTVMYVAIDSSSCNIADTAYASVQILQSENFAAQFSSVPPQPCRDTVVVNLLFTGSGADSLIWNMGDGTIYTNLTQVDYLYTEPGVYVITLTAWDFTCGKTESISQTITVDAGVNAGNIEAPNVFSPNGDAFNPDFRLFYTDLPGVEPLDDMDSYKLLIYNRWGRLVFESNEIIKTWDGKIDGKSVEEGTYFYIARFQRKCWDTEIQAKTGHVTVIR